MSELNTERAVLTYNLDEEYQIRIEEPKDFHESYFRDVYSQAAKAVTGIINQNIDPNGKAYPFAKETKEFNNIVAFVGGRGTGKTSCMVSFAKYLIGKKDKNDRLENFEVNELSECKFVSLPTIDPSLFEKEENIIEVVLAQMFSDFESILKNSQREIDQDIRRKLIEHFDVVYRNLQTIIKGRKNYDGESLETLSKLAQSTNLRDNFKDLIHKFIKLKSDSEKGYLIIPIDDFDLNVKAAAEMSEQIRKYFMIPNVIILMSVNIDQLKDAKELSIRQDFRGMVGFMKEDPAQMAVEYLLKLIPDNRRYYTPEIKFNLSNTHIRRIGLLNNEMKIININNNSDDIKIEEYIYSTIYQKTGLIFLSKEEEGHILIPDTLRRLKEFVFFLEKKLKNGSEYKTQNLHRFEEYIIYTYIPSIISKKYIDYYERIINSDIMRLNFTVVSNIHKIFSDIVFKNNPELYLIEDPLKTFPNSSKDLPKYTLELNELLQRTNNPHNISIGDVLFILKITDRFINSHEFTILCKLIKLIYTIKILILETNNQGKEYKTVVGNSLLPSEDLLRVVPFKKFTNTLLLSRTVFDYKNENNKNNLYKLFVVYNGDNFNFRRRSTRDFFDGYSFNESNNYKLDIFSCFVNLPFLKYNISTKISDENKEIRNEFKITESMLNFIPLHCIDLIETVFYKSFRFDKSDLYKEYISLLKIIINRIDMATPKWSNVNNDIMNNIKQSIIYKQLIIDKKCITNKFKDFVDNLEYTNNIVIKNENIKIHNYFIKLGSLITKPNSNKKLSSFQEEINKFIKSLNSELPKDHALNELLRLVNSELNNDTNMKFKYFVERNLSFLDSIILKIMNL